MSSPPAPSDAVRTDVAKTIIIGAGPTGLALAQGLQKV